MKYKEQKQKLPRTWQENMDWKSKYFETKWKEQYEMSIARKHGLFVVTASVLIVVIEKR